jgi:hypothetical protein
MGARPGIDVGASDIDLGAFYIDRRKTPATTRPRSASPAAPRPLLDASRGPQRRTRRDAAQEPG